jgi:hypothetical protein
MRLGISQPGTDSWKAVEWIFPGGSNDCQLCTGIDRVHVDYLLILFRQLSLVNAKFVHPEILEA